MSDLLPPAARGRPWSEQGCLERLITIVLVLVLAAFCLGAIAFVVMSLS